MFSSNNTSSGSTIIYVAVIWNTPKYCQSECPQMADSNSVRVQSYFIYNDVVSLEVNF